MRHRFLSLVCFLSLLASSLLSVGVEAGMENARFALHRKNKFSPTKSIPNLCDDPSTPTMEPNYSPNFDNAGFGIPCDQYTVTGPVGAPSQVYVVLAQAGIEGVCGVSFGIDYDGGPGIGIDPTFVTWTACADGESHSSDGGFGEFPNPKGGLQITWHYPGSCQNTVIGVRGVHAVIGSLYVYAYSAAKLWVTPNNNVPSKPELSIDDCRGGHLNLLDIWPVPLQDDIVGMVQFGGWPGYTPCWISAPVKSTDMSWGRIKSLYGAPITTQ